VLDHVKIIERGDAPFELRQVVLLEEAEKANARIAKERKRAAHWEPHAFYLSAWTRRRSISPRPTPRSTGRVSSSRRRSRRARRRVRRHRTRQRRLHRRLAEAGGLVAAALIPFSSTTTRTAR